MKVKRCGFSFTGHWKLVIIHLIHNLIRFDHFLNTFYPRPSVLVLYLPRFLGIFIFLFLYEVLKCTCYLRHCHLGRWCRSISRKLRGGWFSVRKGITSDLFCFFASSSQRDCRLIAPLLPPAAPTLGQVTGLLRRKSNQANPPRSLAIFSATAQHRQPSVTHTARTLARRDRAWGPLRQGSPRFVIQFQNKDNSNLLHFWKKN